MQLFKFAKYIDWFNFYPREPNRNPDWMENCVVCPWTVARTETLTSSSGVNSGKNWASGSSTKEQLSWLVSKVDTIAGLLSRKPTSLWDCMEDFACSTALSKRFLFDRKRSSCPVRMDSLDWCKLTSLSSRTRSRLFIASRSYKKKTHSHIPDSSPKII